MNKKFNNFLKKYKIKKNLFRIYGCNDFHILKKQNENIKNLFLKTNFKLSKGWYLTRIYFESNSRNLVGIFSFEKSLFKQKRKYKNGKFFYRLIRLGKSSHIHFQANKEVQNYEIDLFKIPFFLALIIILKKNKQIGTDKIAKFNIAKYWYFYNNNFNYASNGKNIVNYKNYIKIIEPNHIERYGKSTRIHTQYFCLLGYSNFKSVKHKWVIPIKDGDKLSVFALAAFFNTIHRNISCNLIYADEDTLDENNIRKNPKFKTAWNRELFWSDPDFGRCWVIKGSLWNLALDYYKNKSKHAPDIKEIIYFITQYLENKNKRNSIYHLPFICYHRKSSNKEIRNRGGNFKTAEKLYKHLLANKQNLGLVKSVNLLPGINAHKIQWSCPKNLRISIIIPTKNKSSLLEKCFTSINNLSTLRNHQIIIVDNNSNENSSMKYLEHLKTLKSSFDISVETYKGEFNYSLINNYASEKANGDILLFLNNDVEIITPSWDIEIISNSIRKDIGLVGIKLIFPDDYIQHAGVIIGLSNFAGYSHKNFYKNENGYECRIQLAQEYLGLTGAFLAIEKNKWKKLKGMDSKNLAINYNDVDLCLRSHESGFRNIYLPFIEGIHQESSTRGRLKSLYFKQWKKEIHWVKHKWRDVLLKGDSYYNPNLTLLNEEFSFSINPKNENIFKPRNGQIKSFNQ